MLLFLINWWSDRYRRPMKDELLNSYTFEELLYEYYSVTEREKALTENVKAENDKIEEEKQIAAEQWADEEELKDLELLEKQRQATEQQQNKDWMNKYVKEHKDELGDDFGTDIDMNFEKDER